MATLANAKLVTPQGVTQGWLREENGHIAALGHGAPPSDGSHPLDAGGRWVIPGTVDIHLHGGAGAAFTDESAEPIRDIVAFNRGKGVTTVIGGLVAATPEDTHRQVSMLAELADAGEIGGIFLEGPYIAAAKCGAHDPALLRAPDQDEFSRLLKAGRGHLRMLTIAPELPGALALIRRAVAEGVTVAVGHTEATYEQARAAFDAGATVATHLFNAMGPLHHREPGPIAAALTDDRVTVEIINDGVHVHPAAVRLAFAAAGADRIALVTDAMAATGLGDGEYMLGKLRVRVVDGRATVAETGAIASSTIVLPDAIRRAVHEVGVTLPEAVHAATRVPARALGLPGIGSLEPGNAADLVMLDDDLTVAGVAHRGTWLDGR
ncbi:N-acetylglucosamine-6-phosphate deacetylase [Salinactinospora qingdaonensis]|uniref:N-acetylglucosamine-6-phosphate deacetylase n=1 Tax=Salinactinospora qingdaonensis TaxID=702744 RepID=A0ABP7FH72_9ACTN